MTNRITARSLTFAVCTLPFTAGLASAQVTLDYLIDNNPDTIKSTEALIEAFEAENPDISIDYEVRPGGGEGDNIIKTRIATGELPDIFNYNSGSLFQALNPSRFLVDLSGEPFMDNVMENFQQVVSGPDGGVYGVPNETGQGGGIFYNIPVYEELGLEVPKTWDDFMANNAKIAEETDVVPVAQTYRDTWTSQLFVLADFFNVQAAEPDFAEKYTANEVKYASSEAALKGFKRLQEVHDAGYMNEDFGAAGYNDGLRMIATGEAAHYPMLTFAIGALASTYPENMEDVGFFAMPGDDPESNGLTVWMPGATYIPQSSDHIEEAKKFVAFLASPEGCDVTTESIGVTGPYLIEGCELPADVPPSVADLMPYFDSPDTNAPALEFVSPVKGPALEQITVEVGSGIRPAEEGAALYDKDVEKQAQQLGLPNW